MRKRIFFCYAIVVMFVLPSACFGFANPIPDTGRTLCYDDGTLGVIPCPQHGQPFYGQDAQFGPNTHSYTDNGDGTLTRQCNRADVGK